MAFMEGILDVQALPWGTVIAMGAPAVVFGGLLMWFMITCLKDHQRRRSSKLPPVPVVPGLPVIGNLLQLKEKKPHKTFAKWAEVYGPIYSIKTGANRMVVLNSYEVAKEAMVTRYASISSRKLSNALTIITSGKNVVAMSDYNEYYKTSKRHILLSLLGSNAQKRHRVHRDALLENVTKELHASLSMNPHESVNFRKPFQYELFALGFKQGLGMNVDSIYVEQFGMTYKREDIFKVLVTDVMEGGIEIDWRDFFPYLKWIPNKSFEMKIEKIYKNREAVMKALIKEQKKRFDSGQELNCTLDHLLSEAKSFTENQILMLIWESIIETTDTTLVTTEWAMYEIAKDPEKQERLYREIVNICGAEKVTEEDLSQLPYLSAIFHETLRKYSPVPIVPMRYVHEDTQIGGYYVPAGTEIAINIYGCHMDKKMWDSPEEWKPERFLDDKYDQTDLYKTMAFGGGKRVCAGALQAMTITCMAIARLVQEFEWGLSDGERDNVHTLGVTNQKLYPLLVMIKPRN